MRFITVLLIFTATLSADTVVLKNGDKLTGTLITTTEDAIVFKSDLAGEVKIPIANITEVQTANQTTLVTKDGRTLVGTVTTKEDQLVVAPQTGEPTAIPRDTVAAIRGPEGQTQFEELERRQRNPEFLDLYSGFYDFGVAFARGNAETDAINSSAKLNRITDDDNLGFYFTQIFASSSIEGVSGTTAQALRGGWAYSRTLKDSRWFFQGFNDYEYDRFQGLDLRVVVGGGLGYNVIKNEKGFLAISGGTAWNREQFTTGLLRNSMELYVGQEWVYKLSNVWSINEKLMFFPNVSDAGNYRLNFDMSLAAALNRVFALQFSVSDRFLSNPLPGRRQNDVLFTAGVRATIPTREKGKL